MKVWKVSYDGESQYSTNEDVARTYVCGLFAILTKQISRYVDGDLTTEEMRKEILDFAEFGLPEEAEIEEVNADI